MQEEVYQIALTLLPQVGPVTARNLISYCGSPKAVFTASTKDLLSIPRIGHKIAARVLAQGLLEKAHQELERLQRDNIHTLFYLEENYPARLKKYEDSPICLFFKGNGSISPERSIGIVGTRNPSPYGIQVCEKLVTELAPWNATIISGLAYGIDSVAHRTACQSGLSTLGVMANGLGSVYPKSNTPLANRMLEQGGLISEHLYHTEPEKDFFPMRNRIIAGLADVIVVIESGKTGGSLITAEFANRYHKEVFAVPGRVTDERSAGCLFLLKNHKARILESAEDLITNLNWEKSQDYSPRQQELFSDLEGPAKIIVDLLSGVSGKGIDEITLAANLPVAATVSILIDLECRGMVRSLPGKRYEISR